MVFLGYVRTTVLRIVSCFFFNPVEGNVGVSFPLEIHSLFSSSYGQKYPVRHVKQ
jgi:hypothetical protein